MSEETATATAPSESDEPSMEDILSSIRKILAEEEGEGGEPVKGEKSIEQEEVVSEPKDSEQQTPAEETVAGATSEPQNTQEDTPQEEFSDTSGNFFTTMYIDGEVVLADLALAVPQGCADTLCKSCRARSMVQNA